MNLVKLEEEVRIHCLDVSCKADELSENGDSEGLVTLLSDLAEYKTTVDSIVDTYIVKKAELISVKAFIVHKVNSARKSIYNRKLACAEVF